MAHIYYYCSLFLNVLFLIIAADSLPPLKVKTTDISGMTCTTELSSCSLKLKDGSLTIPGAANGPKGDKGDKGMPGIKGEKGMQGLQGMPGATGPPGLNGLSGPIGPPGLKGSKGDMGPKGARGRDGLSGDKGERGLPGPQGMPGDQGYGGLQGRPGAAGTPGMPGLPGAKGIQGKPGTSGPPGPPGQPGLMGSCTCSYLEVPNDNPEESPVEEFGNFDTPSQVVCKDAPKRIELINKKDYYIGPGPIKVNCVDRDDLTLTCISQTEKLSKELKYSSNKEPYWLSSNGLSVKELYNLTHAQIAWIQEKSNSVNQKIRYHCKNSMPFNVSDVDSSVLLLSWNDVIFGPKPTDATPFVYTIPPESDGCSSGGSSSIIEIKSDSAQRLPVVDFLIRDVRDNHSVVVEHLELCFS